MPFSPDPDPRPIYGVAATRGPIALIALVIRLSPLIVPLLALLAGTNTFAQGASTYTPSPIDSLIRAQDSIIAAAGKAIATDSTKIDEYEKIIGIYKARKRFSDELSLADRMRQRNPSASVAHFLYADAQLDNGAPDSAIGSLRKALIIQPTFVRARVTLAEAYTMLKAYDSALGQLDTAIAFNPRYAQAQMQRASLLTLMGRDSEAVLNYQAASELLPDTFTPWLRLGRGLIKIANYGDAIDALKYAMSLNPDSPDALYLYAEANARGGNREEAVKSYERFMIRFPTDKRALDAERAAREMGGGRP
jgi:tetratricopeptide (TPR) repeat protein